MTLEIFKGKTELHIGENHTFSDVADAILEKLGKTEAECLILVMKTKMQEPKFLQAEKEWQELKAKLEVSN